MCHLFIRACSALQSVTRRQPRRTQAQAACTKHENRAYILQQRLEQAAVAAEEALVEARREAAEASAVQVKAAASAARESGAGHACRSSRFANCPEGSVSRSCHVYNYRLSTTSMHLDLKRRLLLKVVAVGALSDTGDTCSLSHVLDHLLEQGQICCTLDDSRGA